MRYGFVAIIVFLIGLGLFLYGGVGYHVWKNFQPEKSNVVKSISAKKSFRPLLSPTAVPSDNVSSFRGNISEVTEGGFAVESKDGNSADILITDRTSFIGGEREELVKGKEVVVSGKADKKGTITANVIVSGNAIGKKFIKR